VEKQATRKQRRADRHATQVDANKTSQACPRCGHSPEDKRPQKGLLFTPAGRSRRLDRRAHCRVETGASSARPGERGRLLRPS
jgi:hypothetical protein